MLALAIAIAFHGFVQRYQFSHLVGFYITRADRLTGRLELCGRHDGNLSCKTATTSVHDPLEEVGDVQVDTVRHSPDNPFAKR